MHKTAEVSLLYYGRLKGPAEMSSKCSLNVVPMSMFTITNVTLLDRREYFVVSPILRIIVFYDPRALV